VKYGRLRWADCVIGNRTLLGRDHFKDRGKEGRGYY